MGHQTASFWQKFRQLYHIKLRNIKYIVHLIWAACVLHNICLQDDNFVDGIMQNNDIPVELNHVDDEEESNTIDARSIRDNFVNILRNAHSWN